MVENGDVMEIKEENEIPKYQELIDLINAAWPDEFGEKNDEEKIEEMEKSHNEKTDTVKYLVDQNKIIGWYRYSLWPRDQEETTIAHIFDIAILPSYQKQGLGTFLMKDIIKDCKKKGIKELLSRSFKNNTGSIRLHQSLGFTEHLRTEDSIVWEYSII